MSKYVVACPDCGSYVELSTGLFGKKKATCACGRVITASSEKMASKCCPHCGNTVMYDRSKGEHAMCPVCHKPINTLSDQLVLIKLSCPSCASELSVNKNAAKATCTLCGHTFDVQRRIAQEEAKKSGAISVIKWDNSKDTFVWKHPIEDFTLGSQLIVHQSQEALFFRDGRALDLFGAGRYTLETQHIPMLNEIYKLPDNAGAALHSEVYFINKSVQTNIKWGTTSSVRIMDPISNIPFAIGARGSFNLEVADARKLILRLVGTSSDFEQEETGGSKGYGIEYVRTKFRDMIGMNVTSLLARAVMENRLNLLTIDTLKPELSRILAAPINQSLEEYGLRIPAGQFYVTDVQTPDDDPNYIRLKKQYATASLDVRDEQVAQLKIQAKDARMMAEKTSEAKMRVFDAQTDAAIGRIDATGVADAAKILAAGSSESTVLAAKGEAERIKLEGFAEVDVYSAQAQAEAAEMKAKGYTYRDETQRQVSMQALQNGLPGTGPVVGGGSAASMGGGMLGDMVGLGMTMGAVGGIMNMTRNTMMPIINDATAIGQSAAGIPNPAIANNGWACSCGMSGITSNFCPQCGAKKPMAAAGWTCTCGKSGITSNFCPECGAKKPMPAVWNCKCGKCGITSKFCPECGATKE